MLDTFLILGARTHDSEPEVIFLGSDGVKYERAWQKAVKDEQFYFVRSFRNPAQLQIVYPQQAATLRRGAEVRRNAELADVEAARRAEIAASKARIAELEGQSLTLAEEKEQIPPSQNPHDDRDREAKKKKSK